MELCVEEVEGHSRRRLFIETRLYVIMERGGTWSATFRLMHMEGRTDTDVDLVLAGILLEVLSDT